MSNPLFDAVLLADILDARDVVTQADRQRAAAELRRLYEVERQRGELLEALRRISVAASASINDCATLDQVSEDAMNAIAKAEGNAPPAP